MIKRNYIEKKIKYFILHNFPFIVTIWRIGKRTNTRLQNFLSFLYSRVQCKPLIHIVGDSHVKAFTNNIHFCTHFVGPATAYSLKNKKNTTDSNKKLFKAIKKINKERDIVILSFGEIDCRLHIYNQYKINEEKIIISELINRTVLNYGEVLKQINEMGVNFYVYSVPPAGIQENIHNFPYYAPKPIRAKIKKEFNEQLATYCEVNNFKFINVYSEVTDKNGYISEEFIIDRIHLNNKVSRLVFNKLNQKNQISYKLK